MATMKVYVYGEGGYDESKPNGNLVDVEEIEAPDEVESTVVAVVVDVAALHEIAAETAKAEDVPAMKAAVTKLIDELLGTAARKKQDEAR